MVVTGGAMVPPDLVRRVRDVFGCGFQTVYAQTEASPVELAGETGVASGDQHGCAEPVDPLEDADQEQSGLVVDMAGRLVRDQQVGTADESTSDRDALLVAAGKRCRQRLALFLQPKPLQ